MQSEFVFSLGSHTFAVSSFQLLVVSAILLGASAFLLLLSRKNRIVVQRSLLTDELMIHLSRIAEALEKQAARGESMDHSIAEAIRRAEERSQAALASQAKSGTDARKIPYSIFGREIQPAE
jgi:hypothetical protein